MPNNDLLAQRMYSPLSQNMTDSESEEELHSNTTTLNNHSSINQSIRKSSMSIRKMSTPLGHHQSSNMHNNHHNHHHSILGSHADDDLNSTNYTNLNSDGEERMPNTDIDNVNILGNITKKPMGPIRKCCFFLSLLVCVLTVVLFLWVIPCSDELACPAKTERIHTHNWIRNYEKIELKGAINVVDGIRGRSKNLVFLYRGDKLFQEFSTANRKRNGIISLVGNTGQVAWYDEIVNEPKIIDCTLIDVDRNGSPDCLVVDEYGEIGTINPISGEWLWHISDRTTKTSEFLSFPLVLPDLNKDGINDLLVAASVGQGLFNNLKIISGANGQTIGISFTMTECSFIHKFQLDRQYKVSFNCINNDTEVQIIKPLADLYSLITNKSVDVGLRRRTTPLPIISQHKFYGQRKDTVSQRNIYSVGGKQLIVENSGKCPENCNVSVQLIGQKNGKNYIIRHLNGTRMYGMVPAPLSFNNSGVHGFVLKFWEWSANDSIDPMQTFRARRHTDSRNDDINRFASVLNKKPAWKLMQTGNDIHMTYKRSVNDDLPVYKSKMNDPPVFKSKIRLIKETVVLIVFNSTDTRIENTSQSNIVQFCREADNSTKDGANTISCQPDLNYQENSLLIADLDSDGSQELVSYYTTFVRNEDLTVEPEEWKLITYVQLLRLESELPKLYSLDEAK